MPLTVPAGLRQFAVDNTAGPASAGQNSEGDRNTFLGAAAGQNSGDAATPVAADDVIAIGRQAAINNKSNLIIVIGNDAAPGLLLDSGHNEGTIVIGHGALASKTLAFTDSPDIVIGRNAMQNCSGGATGGNVVIGEEALQGDLLNDNPLNNVIIGHRAARNINNNSVANSVIIGKEAGKTTGAASNTHNNAVLIGSQAGENISGTANANVAVGVNAMANGSTLSNNVAIGAATMDSLTTGSGNVAVGAAALTATSTGGDNVAIGNDCAIDNLTGIRSVYIGSTVNADTGKSYTDSILIGFRAGATGTGVPITTGAFVVEAVPGIGVNPVPFLFGDMNDANLVLGMHVDVSGVPIDRDLSGSCVLKLLDADSTVGAGGGIPVANPTGGVFLFVDLASGANGELLARFPNGTVAVVAAG